MISGSVHSYVAYLLRLKTSLYLTHENSCYAFTSLAVWKLESRFLAFMVKINPKPN